MAKKARNIAGSSGKRGRDARATGHSNAHGPGPPHRPQPPARGAGDEDFEEAETAAKTLIDRVVLVDLHSGHSTFSLLVIDLTSFSKRASHFSQVYS
jgi:hypothetical protein